MALDFSDLTRDEQEELLLKLERRTDPTVGFGSAAVAGVNKARQDFLDKSLLLATDIGDAVGLVNPKKSASIRRRLDQRQRQFEEDPSVQQFPTLAKGFEGVGKFGLESLVAGAGAGAAAKTVGRLAPKAAALAGDVAGGLAVGGFQDPGTEGSRVTGAAIGGAVGGAAGSAIRGVRSLIPQRVPAMEQAVKETGIPATRRQLIGKTTVRSTLATKREQAVQELKKKAVDALEDDNTVEQLFFNSVKRRQAQTAAKQNVFFDKAFKGTEKAGKFRFRDVKEQVAGHLEQMGEVSSSGATPVLKQLNVFLSKPGLTLKQAHQLRLKISDRVNALGKSQTVQGAAKFELAQLRKAERALKEGIEQRLTQIGRGKNLNKAIEFSKRSKSPFDHPQLRKAIETDKPEELIRVLRTMKDMNAKGRFLRALSPKAKTNLQASIIKESFKKSTTQGLTDPGKFTAKLTQDVKDVGIPLTKETSSLLRGLRNLTEAAKRAPEEIALPIEGGAVGIGQDITVARMLIVGLRRMMDSKVGVKVLSRASKLSPSDMKAQRMVRMIITAGETGAAETAVSPDNSPSSDLSTLTREEQEELFNLLGGDQ